MVKIHECNIGDKVTMALKFQNLQIKKTTSNADYASIVGFDSIELINAKIWNLPQEKKDLLENGKIYICEGVIKDYQGKKQLNISDFREALDGEVEYDDFFEYAPLNKNELQTKISGFINKIKNEKIKDGNEVLKTTVDISKCTDIVTLSFDPGRFVCNNLYYYLLSDYPNKAIFIHIPNCQHESEYQKYAKQIEKIIEILS